MKFKEVEMKYKADSIKLSDFDAFCRGRRLREFILASGYDHFFANKKDSDAFYRHRTGPDKNELTYKRKNSDINNIIRDEQNIDISMNQTKEQVALFLERFKYEYTTSIFKTCFVYKFDIYTFVYYIVYDTEMREIGRFIEIEMSEEHPWSNEQEAYNQLVLLEKLFKPLGITPQSRVKRSLYEMYGKKE